MTALIRFAVTASPLGAMLVAVSGRGICFVAFDDDPNALTHALQPLFPSAVATADDRQINLAIAAVLAAIATPTPILHTVDFNPVPFALSLPKGAGHGRRNSLIVRATHHERLKSTILAPIPSLSLDMQGTAFQQRVWQALREIPSGSTLSYSELAQRIGAPKAIRAVANACAANKLAVLIPCHRVVGKNGQLTGYRWGVKRKEELLRREAVELA